MGIKPKAQGVRSPNTSPRRESRSHGEVGDRDVYCAKETDAGHDGSGKSLPTSLYEISKKADRDKLSRFGNLYTLLNKEALMYAIGELNPKAAAGVDGNTYDEYVLDAEAHAERLVMKLKNKSYRAKLVRRQYIPKLNGKMRVNELKLTLQFKPVRYVVEADIKGFFDNLDHDYLLKMIEQRVDDKAFINLIRKWLKAGVLEKAGEIIHPVSGTPQGGIISPILANIYLDHALDKWFMKVVKANCDARNTYCSMVRKKAEALLFCPLTSLWTQTLRVILR